MSQIINPPFGSNKCHGMVVLINDIFWSIVFIRVTGQIGTKWANVILWLVVKHVPILPYGGVCEYMDPIAKLKFIILGCQIKTNAPQNGASSYLLSDLAERTVFIPVNSCMNKVDTQVFASKPYD